MKTSQYEAFYIVPPQMSDAEVQSLADKFKKVVVDHGGEVLSAAKWDKRKLAYEIQGHKEGNYILMEFKAPTSVPQELNRQLRNNDDVIRHRIFAKESSS